MALAIGARQLVVHDAMEMIDAAGRGELRALYVIGWDILMTQPHADATRRALARLDGLVVQDLFLNETARELATVFLPAAASFEKDGTFMSSERRIQRVRPVVDPPPGARSDANIIAALATSLGRGVLFDYISAADVWDEIRAVWGAGGGISYGRLDAPGGLQWPCPNEDHPGTPRLFEGGRFLHPDGRARFLATPSCSTARFAKEVRFLSTALQMRVKPISTTILPSSSSMMM